MDIHCYGQMNVLGFSLKATHRLLNFEDLSSNAMLFSSLRSQTLHLASLLLDEANLKTSIPLNLPLHRAVWSVNSPGPRVIGLLTLRINSIITASFLRSLSIKLINMLYPISLHPFPIVLSSFALISLIVKVDLRNQSKDDYKQPAYSNRSTSQALHS